jgi:hypothetical protein
MANPFLQKARDEEFNKLEELYKLLLNLHQDGPYNTLFNGPMYKELHQKREEMLEFLVELGNELNQSKLNLELSN